MKIGKHVRPLCGHLSVVDDGFQHQTPYYAHVTSGPESHVVIYSRYRLNEHALAAFYRTKSKASARVIHEKCQRLGHTRRGF